MNILFLDSQIPDYQNLAQAAVGATQVVILDSARDGIAQITDYLSKNAPVDSIHIVSHGSPGTLYLGNTTLGLSIGDKLRFSLICQGGRKICQTLSR